MLKLNMVYVPVKKYIGKCKFCFKSFKGNRRKQFCSGNCTVLWHRYKKTREELFKKICLWCQKPYDAFRSDDKYCSEYCRNKTYFHKHRSLTTQRELDRLKKRKKCASCNRPFSVRRLSQRCCGRICYANYYDRHLRPRDENARIRSRAHYLKNRDRTRADEYKISIEQYKEITKKCFFCEFKEIVDCHHIIPKSKGGADELSNYVGVCPNHHKLIHLRNYIVQKTESGFNLLKKP